MTSAFGLLLFALCFYLPGRAWFAVVLRSQAAAASFAPRLFVEVTLSTVITTWLGLLLLDLGVFSAMSLATLLAVVSVAGAATGWKIPRQPYRRLDIGVLVIWVAAFAALWPPIPAYLGGGDGSAYLAAAAAAQRTGGLVVPDPSVTLLDADFRRLFFPSVSADWGSPPYVRLEGGLILRNLDSGEVLPAFHHALLPWLALGSQWFGLLQMGGVVPLFSSLGLVGIFLLLRQLSTLWVGALAAVLLLVQPPFAFYGRFPQPEAVASSFLVAGACLLMEGERGAWRASVLAGIVLGTAALLRAELLFLIPVALLFARTAEPGPRTLATLVGFAPTFGAALLQAATYRTHYWGNAAAFIGEHAGLLLAGTALAAILGCSAKSVRVLSTGVALWLPGAAFLLALLELFLGRNQPLEWLVEASGPLLFVGGGGLLFLGACKSAAPPQAKATLTFFAGLGAASLLLYGFASNAAPVPWWVFRRSVPALLPALVTVACLFAATLVRRQPRLGAAVVAFLLLSAFTLPGRILRSAPYLASASHHAEALRHALRPNCVVLLSADLAPLAPALWLWGAHGCAPYYVAPSDCEKLSSLTEAMSQRFPLFVLSTQLPPNCPGLAGRPEPLATYRFVLRAPFDAMHFTTTPGSVAEEYKLYDIAIYRWKSADK